MQSDICYPEKEIIEEFNTYIENLHNGSIPEKIEKKDKADDTDENYEEITFILEDLINSEDVSIKLPEYSEMIKSFISKKNAAPIINIILKELENEKYLGEMLTNISSSDNIKIISETIFLCQNQKIFDNLKKTKEIFKFVDTFHSIYMNLPTKIVIELVENKILDLKHIENAFIEACQHSHIEFIECVIKNKLIHNNDTYAKGLIVSNKKNITLIKYLLDNTNMYSVSTLIECMDQCISNNNTTSLDLFIKWAEDNNANEIVNKYKIEHAHYEQLLLLCKDIKIKFNTFTKLLEQCERNNNLTQCLFRCAKECIAQEHFDSIKYILEHDFLKHHPEYDDLLMDLKYDADLCYNFEITNFVNLIDNK